MKIQEKPMQIAIDGPAASGKSTAAGMLARKLGFLYIDTGAMYRAVTLQGIKEGADFANEKLIEEIASRMEIGISQDPETSRGYKVSINGTDVTDELFTPAVDAKVSETARIGAVRRIMVEQQRDIAKENDVVMAGRDIASNVLTGADLKIFLTADPHVRAQRRLKELEQKGEKKEFDDILENIRQRDRIDSTREDNPLIKTDDAVEVDCSNLTISKMVDIIEDYAHRIRRI
jgi:cytidylate kinase